MQLISRRRFGLGLLAVGLAGGGVARAQDGTLLGTWLSPVGELTFLADGRVVGRQLSGGVVFSSFGYYAVQGNVLSLRFESVAPARQCNIYDCIPATPMPSMTHRIAFENPNVFMLGVEAPGAARFQRVR